MAREHVEKGDKSRIFLPGIYRLILVEEGSCRVTIADGSDSVNGADVTSTSLLLREGDIRFLQPNSYSDISMAAHSRAQMIGFVAIGIEGCKRERRMLVPPRMPQISPVPNSCGVTIFPASYPSATSPASSTTSATSPRSGGKTTGTTSLLTINSATYYSPSFSTNVPAAKGNRGKQHPHFIHGLNINSGPSWLTHIQQLIDARLPMLHSTADLAAAIGRNPQAMARVFRQYVGVTPAVYLRQRLSNAPSN